MTNVLYITYDGLTDPLGQSQVLPYLVELAKERTWAFTILSFEKQERFDRESAIIYPILRESGIEWVPLTFTKNPPIISKMYDRWRLKHTAVSLHKKFNFSMVHCRSYVAAEVGLFLKSKFGTKFLFDMRGFWPDEKKDSGHWDTKWFFYKWIYDFYKKKEEKFLFMADGIVSLTNAARNMIWLQSKYEMLNIDVIPCCADLDHFNYEILCEQIVSKLKNELGIGSGNKAITYLGSIGGWYMVEEMFVFFRKLCEKSPEYKILFLTKDDPQRVLELASRAGIDESRLIVKYAKRQDLPSHLAISNCSLFFIKPFYSKIASSPTKHGELMGMGIPVICNDIGDTGAIVKEMGTGLIVEKFDSDEYDSIIMKIGEIEAIPKEHIRKAAFKYFDLKMGVDQYKSIYNRIVTE